MACLQVGYVPQSGGKRRVAFGGIFVCEKCYLWGMCEQNLRYGAGVKKAGFREAWLLNPRRAGANMAVAILVG